MLTFSGALRVFIALDPCDMRAGINTLLALTGEKLREDPKSGSLFVFNNKSHRLLKVLYWDGSGFRMMTKRLESGTFCWPRAAAEGQVKLALKPEAFALLTDSRPQGDSQPAGCPAGVSGSEAISICIGRDRAAGMSGIEVPPRRYPDIPANGY